MKLETACIYHLYIYIYPSKQLVLRNTSTHTHSPLLLCLYTLVSSWSKKTTSKVEVCVLSYFACTVRLIAATVCTFGDALGCCWPPKVAPLQVGFCGRVGRVGWEAPTKIDGIGGGVNVCLKKSYLVLKGLDLRGYMDPLKGNLTIWPIWLEEMMLTPLILLLYQVVLVLGCHSGIFQVLELLLTRSMIVYTPFKL